MISHREQYALLFRGEGGGDRNIFQLVSLIHYPVYYAGPEDIPINLNNNIEVEVQSAVG